MKQAEAVGVVRHAAQEVFRDMPSFSVPSQPDEYHAGARFQAPPPGRKPGVAGTPSGPRARRYAPAGTHHHHPRVLAALCYTVPIVPSWVLLAREPRNPFVRFHAAQSIVFYGLVAAAQILLYAMLVLAGGLITNDLLAASVALLVVVLFVALAAAVAFVWSRLIADCIRGQTRLLPVVGRWAMRLERFSPRAIWARWHLRFASLR